MKATYHDRLVAGLKARGYKQVDGRSHYTTFEARKPGFYIFIGTNGALRYGECASRSRSVGDASRQSANYTSLLADGDTALEETRPKSKVEALTALLK